MTPDCVRACVATGRQSPTLRRRAGNSTRSRLRGGERALPIRRDPGHRDRRERGSLVETHLAGLAQLEQGDERDRLLEAREPGDLVVEAKPGAPAHERSEALEEALDRRQLERQVGERRAGRLGGEGAERGGESCRLLRCERTLRPRRKRRRAEPEEAVGLLRQALLQPGRAGLDAPVLGEPLRQLGGCLVGIEVFEPELVFVARTARAPSARAARRRGRGTRRRPRATGPGLRHRPRSPSARRTPARPRRPARLRAAAPP